jgi:integrase
MEDHSTNSGARLLRRHFRKYDLFRSPHLIVFLVLVKDHADCSRPMATSQFRTELKRAIKAIGLDLTRFAGHSLRAGGATDLFNANVPHPIIKRMGRWRSDAAMIYYRDEDAVTKATTKGFASLASRPRHGLEQYHIARPKTK